MDLAILKKLKANMLVGYLFFNGRRLKKGQKKIQIRSLQTWSCKLLKK